MFLVQGVLEIEYKGQPAIRRGCAGIELYWSSPIEGAIVSKHDFPRANTIVEHIDIYPSELYYCPHDTQNDNEPIRSKSLQKHKGKRRGNVVLIGWRLVQMSLLSGEK